MKKQRRQERLLEAGALTHQPMRREFDALVERLRAVRWLAPDAGLDLLTTEEREWLEARHDEFSAAVGRLPSPLEVTGALEVSSNAYAVGERWAARWAEARKKSPAPALIASLNDALAGADSTAAALVTPELRSALDAELTRAAREWGGPQPQGYAHRTPALRVIELHCQWLRRHGAERASDSPWCALLEVWMRGAWPLVLPDGGWMVFVPMWKNGRGTPAPERADAPLPTVEAGALGYADDLEALGLGPPPRVIRLPSPTRDYFMYQLPAGLRRNPDKVGAMAAAVYQFNIAGEGSWTLDMRAAPPTVLEGQSGVTDITIDISDSDFESLMIAPQSAMKLFFAGRLKVRGNNMLAMNLQKLLNLP